MENDKDGLFHNLQRYYPISILLSHHHVIDNGLFKLEFSRMKYFILFMILTASYPSQAQSIERQLIGSTGFSAQLTTAGLDCTVGEPLIAFSSSADNILSQGFLQPAMDGGIYVEDIENTFLLLYPNPTRNHFFIESDEVITQLEMFDARGRLVFSKKSNMQNNAIHPGDLAQGLYHVKITIDSTNYFRKIQIL